MAIIVYGLFPAEQGAEQAARELARNALEHPAFAVQTHLRGPLDGDDLPESATEIGRNTVIAVVAGGVGGLALGATAGATLDIMGLTFAIGAGFGLLTGLLSGLLGGMMAGTRRPKPALREIAERLDGEAVLLTVEVGEAAQVEVALAILDGHGAVMTDSC